MPLPVSSSVLRRRSPIWTASHVAAVWVLSTRIRSLIRCRPPPVAALIAARMVPTLPQAVTVSFMAFTVCVSR